MHKSLKLYRNDHSLQHSLTLTVLLAICTALFTFTTGTPIGRDGLIAQPEIGAIIAAYYSMAPIVGGVRLWLYKERYAPFGAKFNSMFVITELAGSTVMLLGFSGAHILLCYYFGLDYFSLAVSGAFWSPGGLALFASSIFVAFTRYPLGMNHGNAQAYEAYRRNLKESGKTHENS